MDSIESTPPPAFSSLRSRFEQLSALDTPRTQPKLLSVDPSNASPRPRAISSTQETRPNHIHLRSASSSSDLNMNAAGAKRPPPPPPPPRGSAKSGFTPSPSASPLSRPVPLPRGEDEMLTGMPLGGVKSLRNKFSNPQVPSPPRLSTYTPSHTPRQSLTSIHPERDLLDMHTPARQPDEQHLRGSPFSDGGTSSESDEEARCSPPLPPRRTQPNNNHRHQSSESTLSTSNSGSVLMSIESDDTSIEDTSYHKPTVPSRPSVVVPPPPPPRPKQHYTTESPISASTLSLQPPPLPLRRSTAAPLPSEDPNPNHNQHPPPPLQPPRLPVRPTTVAAPEIVVSPIQSSIPYAIHHNSIPPERKTSGSSSSSSLSRLPPPPPARRPPTPTSDQDQAEDIALEIAAPIPITERKSSGLSLSRLPPPPPTRSVAPARPKIQSTTALSDDEYDADTVIPPERKSSGLTRLPPPPTRTIAPGSKLPPARRPPTPSSDDDSAPEEAEGDAKSAVVDQLPDSSRSSRRAPILVDCFKHSTAKIQVHAHSGQVAVSGSHVVVSSLHHLRIFDLAQSEAPVWTLETKGPALGAHHMKDTKIGCVEFRPAGRASDRGFFVWVGTREGHLFEVDVRTGAVTCTKPAAHNGGHGVTHIFRHGRCMVTLDGTGKVLVFTPDGEEDVQLGSTQPRVFRIAEKQEWAKILGGLLWTSTRADMTAGSGPTSKAPIVRVYDIFTPGSVGRAIHPTDHVGAVTSGSILPSQLQNVYLGHEGGFISIWSILTPDGIPQCIEVMKVGASDVLSLEGVGERLWAGGRKGVISAYDVVPRPWVVTNAWNAHPELPVLRLATDPYSIEKLGRLCVVSVGRDEQVRLWDGLLGLDWIDQELLKREHSFSTFRNLNVLIVSWNIDAAKPDALTHDSTNVTFLHDVLKSVDSPDIISFGFQEAIDLESRKMTAKTVLLGGKKKGHEEGKISEKVTSAYKRWHDCLVSAVRLAMPPNSPYTVVETENLVGLFSCIFVKNSERLSLNDVAITTIKRGMGGIFGNKGGILARFTIDDSSICMINCHLAAGQHHVRQRNEDVAAMVEEKSVFPSVGELDEATAYVGGGDGSRVMDHEIVFVNGDMNYRIDYRRDAIIAAVHAGDFEMLATHDQLIKQMKFNRGFRFRSFSEGPLTFAPTYKYDRHSSEYDSSEKRRLPAWCDRILWRSRELKRVKQLHYRRWEANVSDHRPISAGFTVTVKSVRHELRAVAKAEVHGIWVEHQRQLLLSAKKYYVNQALI